MPDFPVEVPGELIRDAQTILAEAHLLPQPSRMRLWIDGESKEVQADG